MLPLDYFITINIFDEIQVLLLFFFLLLLIDVQRKLL